MEQGENTFGISKIDNSGETRELEISSLKSNTKVTTMSDTISPENTDQLVLPSGVDQSQNDDSLQAKNSRNFELNDQVMSNGLVDGNPQTTGIKSDTLNPGSESSPQVMQTSTSSVNGDSGITEENVSGNDSKLEVENDTESIHRQRENILITPNETTEDEEDSVWPSDDDESEGSGSESDLEDNLDDSYESHRENKYLLRDPNPVLPETVTTLTTPDGGKVYLVGTAHFSVESQNDVTQTIQATQPDVVMVELCKSRVGILSLDEKTILEESKNMNFEKIRSAIKQSGIVQGVMYLLLLTMSAHLTRELGMAPGGEFRRAFTEAKKVSGCLIHLGDRPMHITLQRAIAALSWWQKVRLAWCILTSREPISKEEVERCKQRDLLEEMLAEMTGEFPALSTVFLKERDIYLAYSLKLAATPIPTTSTPEGIIPAVVVGVVGMGHVPGIVENWERVTEKDIPPILKIPEPTLTSRVLRKTFKYSLLGLALWGCYRLLPSSITSTLSPRRSFEWISSVLERQHALR